MWILPLVGYLGYAVGFVFLTLSIASGLYYLSELVEEHTVIAKKLITRMIYAVISVVLLLWLVDGFPFWHTVAGVASHLVYLGNMRRFPFVRMTDPLFLASCVLVFFNHYICVSWLQQAQQAAYERMSSYYERPDVPSFAEVASFIGLCVWLVPFALFISLSAGDNVLPTMGSGDLHAATESTDIDDGGRGRTKRQGMVKALVDSVTGMIGEATRMAGVSGGRRDRGGGVL